MTSGTLLTPTYAPLSQEGQRKSIILPPLLLGPELDDADVRHRLRPDLPNRPSCEQSNIMVPHELAREANLTPRSSDWVSKSLRGVILALISD